MASGLGTSAVSTHHVSHVLQRGQFLSCLFVHLTTLRILIKFGISDLHFLARRSEITPALLKSNVTAENIDLECGTHIG